MTTPQITISLILAAAIVLFAWGRWRGDVVAALALLAAVLAGVVPVDRMFEGFSDSAVALLAAVLAVGAAVRASGVLEAAARPLGPVLQRTGLQVAVLGGMTALASALMGGAAALAALLPAALQLARRNRRSPAPVLMPMAFASLLGGLATLVGTPANLVVSSARRQALGAGYALLDFAPVGVALSATGLAWLALAWRRLPRTRDEEDSAAGSAPVEGYTSEVVVPRGSAMAGQTVGAFEARGEGEVAVVAIIREELRRMAPRRASVIEPDDVLVLACEPDALQRLMERSGLRIVGGRGGRAVDPERVGVVEAVVAPGSELAGRSPAQSGLDERFGVSVLAVGRSGGRIGMRLRRAKLRAGDVLVLQGELDAMPGVLAALGCLPLAERRLRLGRQRRAFVPALVLLGAAALAAVGVVPVAVAFLGAAVLLVLLRALTLNELYGSVAWPVLVLIGAFLPVSRALRDTGTAELAAGWLASAGVAPAVLVALVLVVALAAAPVVGGVATALVAAPLAAGLAARLGVGADPFLMAVAVGASCAFLARDSQANALVTGVGGYGAGDFRRLGLPLAALVALVGTPVILLAWPLR